MLLRYKAFYVGARVSSWNDAQTYTAKEKYYLAINSAK